MIRLVDVYDGSRIREGALEFLYELMKERDPEINISHSTLPSFEQHRAFVTRRPFRFWYLLEKHGRVDTAPASVPGIPGKWLVGYVSVTHANEIGIVLLTVHRGKGYGPEAVGLLMAQHKPNPAEPGVRNGHWLANIAPANERSRHMFQKLGFRKIQETFELPEEENHGQEATAKPA